MSEKKHTPGPWKVVTPGHGHETGLRSVQMGANEMYTTLEVLPADACLIAAAPDLLAACEAARRELRLLREKDDCGVYDPTVRIALDAAIAKAKNGGAK